MGHWFRRRVWLPLLALLRTGITPERLALCVALGIVVGNIPLLGVSTILCTGIALLFRLNLAAMQLVQAAMAPTQLLLIIPFVRLGEWLLQSKPQPLSIAAARSVLAGGPGAGMATLGQAMLHALLAFILLAPIATWLLYQILRRVLRLARA